MEEPPKPATKSDHGREGVGRKLPGYFIQDQKDMWVTYPRKPVTGHYLLPTARVVGGTAAFIASDHQPRHIFDSPIFFQDSDRSLDGKAPEELLQRFGSGYAYMVTLLRHDSRILLPTYCAAQRPDL
jgi:hypothetical protein